MGCLMSAALFFNKRRRASETGGDKAGNVERVNSPVSLSLCVAAGSGLYPDKGVMC